MDDKYSDGKYECDQPQRKDRLPSFPAFAYVSDHCVERTPFTCGALWLCWEHCAFTLDTLDAWNRMDSSTADRSLYEYRPCEQVQPDKLRTIIRTHLLSCENVGTIIGVG